VLFLKSENEIISTDFAPKVPTITAMSTKGQFSSKNPTIKRIMKEAAELANQPSSDYHAAPLETDLFEWHFTLRGPPAPSPFEGGVYHGRIVLPPAYPLKPPSFRFLTPSGRFEVNREICLSISGHHEETWQPAWGIRTALVAIRSFMDTNARGQLGGMEASDEVRKRMAGKSVGWKCLVCGKANGDVMREQEEAAKQKGDCDTKNEEQVPGDLRLAYREDLNKTNGQSEALSRTEAASSTHGSAQAKPQPRQVEAVAAGSYPQPVDPTTHGMREQAPEQVQRPHRQPVDEIPAWIDKAIYGIVIALIFLIYRRWVSP